MSNVYQHQLVLDKAYYQECFEQSEQPKSFSQLYAKAIFFIVLGMVLVLFTEVNDYAAWFIFALGILEIVAQIYRKAWWVTRQMLSKESKTTVDLTIDEQHITTKSFYHQQRIAWQEISEIKPTEKGYLILHPAGANYLSKQHLNDWAEDLIRAHIKSQTS
ncbi:YcxB family protein [Thalassotalea ganghwensis]